MCIRDSPGEDPRTLLKAVQSAFAGKGEFEVLRLTGSELHIGIASDSPLVADLLALGFEQDQVQEPVWQSAPAAGVAPENFYSTTHHRTQVWLSGEWKEVADQRMDGCLTHDDGQPRCVKLRDLSKGDPVLVGFDGVRVVHAESEDDDHDFAFMANDVSSERRAEVQTARVVEPVSYTHLTLPTKRIV